MRKPALTRAWVRRLPWVAVALVVLVVLAASRAIDELDARQAAQADEAPAATTCAAEVVVPVPDSNPGWSRTARRCWR